MIHMANLLTNGMEKRIHLISLMMMCEQSRDKKTQQQQHSFILSIIVVAFFTQSHSHTHIGTLISGALSSVTKSESPLKDDLDRHWNVWFNTFGLLFCVAHKERSSVFVATWAVTNPLLYLLYPWSVFRMGLRSFLNHQLSLWRLNYRRDDRGGR